MIPILGEKPSVAPVQPIDTGNKERRGRQMRRDAAKFIDGAVGYLVVGFREDTGLVLLGDVNKCGNPNDVRNAFMNLLRENIGKVVDGFCEQLAALREEQEAARKAEEFKEKRSEELAKG